MIDALTHPQKGETYFIVSDYSDDPYEFVWQGSKADFNRFASKTLYHTLPEALDAIIERKGIKRESVEVLGAPLTRWTHKLCVADFGVGTDWATLYLINSAEEGKGHATELLAQAKRYYQAGGKKFGGSPALNETIRDIYRRLGIAEYEQNE